MVYPGDGYKVAVIDLGVKRNIIKSLLKRGCQVTVYPAETPAKEIIADAPDGIMLTNGPGDPKDCKVTIKEVKKLFDTDIPIFAICLGHQLLALANGGDTVKMKYGHRGANHPVKDLKTGKVYISTQNHGYMVKEVCIKRTGTCFRMELYGLCILTKVMNTFYCTIIYIDKADLGNLSVKALFFYHISMILS